MPEASDFIAQLEASYRNTDFDWESLLEANYIALLSGHDGLGIIDIGGHAGRHSLVIQRKLNPSHLLIFEPLPDQRRSLKTTFSRYANVTVYDCALGNRRGETTRRRDAWPTTACARRSTRAARRGRGRP